MFYTALGFSHEVMSSSWKKHMSWTHTARCPAQPLVIGPAARGDGDGFNDPRPTVRTDSLLEGMRFETPVSF